MPFALQIGITFDEYMDMAPEEFYSRAIIYRNQKEERINENNEFAWLLGVYMQRAVSSVFSNKSKYPSEPIPMFSEEKEIEKVKEKNNKEEIFKAQFTKWANDFNKKIKERG